MCVRGCVYVALFACACVFWRKTSRESIDSKTTDHHHHQQQQHHHHHQWQKPVRMCAGTVVGVACRTGRGLGETRRSPFCDLVRDSVSKFFSWTQDTQLTAHTRTHTPTHTHPHWHRLCGVSALGAEETAAPVRHTATLFRLARRFWALVLMCGWDQSYTVSPDKSPHFYFTFLLFNFISRQ